MNLLPGNTNPASAYLDGLARGGKASQRSALRAISIQLGYGTPFEIAWADLTADQIRTLRTQLRGLYAPATLNRMLSAIRGVLRIAHNGAVPEPLRQVLEHSEDTSGPPAGRELGADELKALLAAARPTLEEQRTVGMIAVMVGSGLRRDSIPKLDATDWQPERGVLVARRAKGDKTYEAAMLPSLVPFLARWLELRHGDPGPMFPAITNGRIILRRLAVSTISAAIEELRVRADVAPFTSHDLRRTFASGLLDRGVDLSAVSKLMGHGDTKTTARYDRRKTDRLVELVRKADK